jgi:hypothetical protein
MENVDQRWRKSSFSGNGGECVAVGHVQDMIAVQDTRDHTGPVLRFSAAAWRRFAEQVKRSSASGLILESAKAGRGRTALVLGDDR